MEQIVNSYNIFIDSSHAITSGCKGDDFHVNLQDSGVHAGDGQIIRLTLDNFSMHKNFYDVNATNSTFIVKTDLNTTGKEYNLTHQNITNLNQLATDFQQKVIEAINEQSGQETATAGAVSPDAFCSTPHVISFEVTALPSSITSVNIEFPATSDIYQLLGGNRRVINTGSSQQQDSVYIDITGTTLTVKGLYPGQMSTTPFVYIRCPGTSNTNLETSSMSGIKDVSNFQNLTAHSYILGRAMADTFYVQYNPTTGREFFLDLKQSQLNSLELRLTDSKNRPLGRTGTHAGNQTAAGTGTTQSTLGNLEFTAVLRVDIIQKRHPKSFESQKIEPRIPARFSQILQKQSNGKDEFGKSPGFQ